MALETSWLEEHLKGGEVHHLYAALEERNRDEEAREKSVPNYHLWREWKKRNEGREMHFQLALALVTSFLAGFTLKSCQIDVQSAT